MQSKTDFKGGAVQWATPDGKLFSPTTSTVKHLVPGFYEASATSDGTPFFNKLQTATEELLRLPNSKVDEILDELTKFWDLAPRFKENGLVHKRGVLVMGDSGTGKSCCIRLVVDDVIKRGGVALNFNNGARIFLHCVRLLRDIQPDTPIVVVMEDLDAILEISGQESSILNILDGVEAIDHVVYLASTNFPEKLQNRIANRPSRFDRRIVFGYPDAQQREAYLLHINKKPGLDIGRYVRDTEKLSFAHLLELYITTAILDNKYEDALESIRRMSYVPKSQDFSREGSGKMGFLEEVKF